MILTPRLHCAHPEDHEGGKVALGSATVEPKVKARSGVEERARGRRQGRDSSERERERADGPQQRARAGATEAGRSGAGKQETGRTTREGAREGKPEMLNLCWGESEPNRVCKGCILQQKQVLETTKNSKRVGRHQLVSR